MIYSIVSATLVGIHAKQVLVEVDLLNRLPAISIVGLPGISVKESADRIRSAILQSGYPMPRKRIVINLAPADLKKQGTAFDLPIAIAILLAQKDMYSSRASAALFVGELSLDGSLRPIRGALSFAILARDMGCQFLVLPKGNVEEAAMVRDIVICGFQSLREILDWISHQTSNPALPYLNNTTAHTSLLDMRDVQGQAFAKRALEIAAAGGHNILLLGSPGCGKSMLAQRMTSILPALQFQEALEITQIHSCFDAGAGLIQKRPFRAPHHSISLSALTGTAKLLPGEISLAHNGVLFLDEIIEFRRDVLEALRTPMQDGFIKLRRANGAYSFPSRFSLIAAANPCPCGWLNHPTKICRCRPAQIERYQAKLSGPLLDRIDMHVWMDPVSPQEILTDLAPEGSTQIQARVEKAREAQIQRVRSGTKKSHGSVFSNANLSAKELHHNLIQDDHLKRWFLEQIEQRDLSARAWNSILKLARTIADLAQEEQIQKTHILEAFLYKRNLFSTMKERTCRS